MSKQHGDKTLLGPFRVLDLTNEKGLLCGKILGILGADVIKVERPGGDPARNIGPFYHDIPDPEKSLYWFAFNVNKRGITLDIEAPDGRDIFKRLVKTADFVIESYRPGYMEGLGLGYDTLSEINPGVIMTSITPFGQSGPYKDFKGADIVVWAMGGMLYLAGDPDRAPLQTGIPQAYVLGSLHAAMASLIAFYHREVTGEGQHVDVSIQQAVILATQFATETWNILKLNSKRTGHATLTVRPTPPGPLYRRSTWQCKDGMVGLNVSGGAAGQVAAAKRFTKMMERDGMAGELKDYDWETYDDSTITQQERDSLDEPIARFLLTKTKAELYEEAVRQQITLAPVSTVKDLAESPQLAAREFWVKVEHPELGETITYSGAFTKLSEGQRRAWFRAPLIGEHNEQVYGELGLSREDLILLKQAGVV